MEIQNSNTTQICNFPRYNGVETSSKVITLNRDEFVSEHFTTDQGNPFLFDKGREYWKTIYNVRWRMIVIISSRQAEKSSYCAKSILSDLFTVPGEEIMYATAHSQHLSIFVKDKIDKQFYYRPNLARLYYGRDTMDNVHEKMFKNGSRLHLRAIGQNPTSGRAATARLVYFDETQDILSDNIPIVMEVTQSYSDSAGYAFLGTPLTPQNVLSRRWENSCQYEYLITCKHCFRINPPLGKEHIDVTKPYLFCVYCGREMGSENGQWVMMNPEGEYPGFRVCRLMTPTCRWRTDAHDGVLDKLDGPNAYPEHQFVNEVLGLPEGVGVQPISEKLLYANCASTPDEDYEWLDVQRPPAWLLSVDVIGTIDWAWATREGGMSYTIYAIWCLFNGRFKCLFAKRQVGPKYRDPELSLNEMADAFTRCGAKIIGTDYGVGHKENMRLRTKMASSNCKVFEFLYTGSYSTPKWNPNEARYEVGRTESLDFVFNDLTRRQFLLPRRELAKQYLEDVMNVYVEMDPNSKRKKYEHAGTGPDDFLHLMNYARLTFRKMMVPR